MAEGGRLTGRGYVLSSMKFSERCNFSTQLGTRLHLELLLLPLLLLPVVEACWQDKSMRHTWKDVNGHSPVTKIMQPTSVTRTGASGRGQSGWIVSLNVWRRGGGDLSMNAMLLYYRGEREWLLGNWMTGFALRLSCTRNWVRIHRQQTGSPESVTVSLWNQLQWFSNLRQTNHTGGKKDSPFPLCTLKNRA